MGHYINGTMSFACCKLVRVLSSLHCSHPHLSSETSGGKGECEGSETGDCLFGECQIDKACVPPCVCIPYMCL